ncbi:hypothetical protein EDB84DRAFT_1522197, partial [Lactarius hengduanensis]
MPGVFFQRHHSQQNALGGIESPSLSTRMAAVNDLQKSLVNFKLRSADCDMDVARNLLQQHIHLIEIEDQEVIGLLYDDLEDIESRLEKTKSRLKRWVLNMHFKRVSKTTYMVIKDASDRAIDRQIRNKLREASSSRGLPTSPPPPAPPAHRAEQTTVQPISPDPHAILPFADSRPSSCKVHMCSACATPPNGHARCVHDDSATSASIPGSRLLCLRSSIILRLCLRPL